MVKGVPNWIGHQHSDRIEWVIERDHQNGGDENKFLLDCSRLISECQISDRVEDGSHDRDGKEDEPNHYGEYCELGIDHVKLA